MAGPKYISAPGIIFQSLKVSKTADTVILVSMPDFPESAANLRTTKARSFSVNHLASSGKPATRKKAATEQTQVRMPSRMKIQRHAE